MNPGPVEEVGKATGTFMNIMKDQPLSLALAIMNLCLLALFYYIAQVASSNRRFEFQALQDGQREINKLLYNCTPTGGLRLQSDESHPFLFQMPQPRPAEADTTPQ